MFPFLIDDSRPIHLARREDLGPAAATTSPAD